MTRTLLVVACCALLVLILVAMRAGWRHRAARQAGLPPLPGVPSGADALDAQTGLYVGTTYAGSWQDRVVAHSLGRRASAGMSLRPDGVLIDRAGAPPIFVPVGAVVAARLTPGLAGRVVGGGGLLVIRWRHGDAELDTGVRFDDRSAYPVWVRRLNARVSA